MLEVELRGLLSKAKYHDLTAQLERISDQVEEDNKTAYFYTIDNGILKVVDETSKSKYKLSLKIGDEFSGNGLNEMETYLTDQSSLHECMAILSTLGYTQKSVIKQRRKNYLYKGVAISLKHTPSWSYHFEAEILVNTEEEVTEARAHIEKICSDLSIIPMNEDELKTFIANLT